MACGYLGYWSGVLACHIASCEQRAYRFQALSRKALQYCVVRRLALLDQQGTRGCNGKQDRLRQAATVYERGFSCCARNTVSFCANKRAGDLAHLLLLPQGKQTDTRYLYDLETDTWDITLCFTLSTETRDEDLIVLIDKVQATIVGDLRIHLMSDVRRELQDRNARKR